MGKLQKLYRELGSVRQIAQDVLSIINLRPGLSSASTLGSARSAYFTASEYFDQESGIYINEEYNTKGVDFMARLPRELVLVILSYLDITDFLNCFVVSKSWHQLFNSHSSWKVMYYKQFGDLRPHSSYSYAEFYRNRHLLDSNWTSKNLKSHALYGHLDSVYCAQLVGNRIYTGSRDNTIRVWDLESTSLITTIHTHTASVLCLDADEQLLVSGSSDAVCIVYSIPSYRELFKLRGHSAHVLSVLLTSTYILSCSKDGSVAAYRRNNGEILWRIANAHESAVNSMATKDNVLFTAGGDGTIRRWDIHTGNSLGKFHGHTRGIACLVIDRLNNQILSGGNDRSIRIWDLETGECIRQLRGHQNLVRSLHIIGKKIVSASYDRTIRVWDNKGECIAQYQGLHGSWIFCVCGNSKYIISTSVGKKPLVLDFTRGLDRGVGQYIA